MIIIFGGTTEGRKAAQVVDKAGKTFYYSTKGNKQEVTSLHGTRLTGAMDSYAMKTFCLHHNIRLLVDAAHPFAEQLRDTIDRVSEELDLPVIRFDRIYPPRQKDIIWCEDYDDALIKLKQTNINRLLSLSGVNTISKLKAFWQNYPTWFRILNRKESLEIAAKEGFPEERLLFYDGTNDDSDLFETLQPDAILLKESGITGGFDKKTQLAGKAGIKIFAIKLPPVPDSFYKVNGEHGLRLAIEQLMPDFFPLRTGITTGSCATAAATAALKSIFTQEEQASVPITLPNGETIVIPIKETNIKENTASTQIIKDSGDDTDVTNHTIIEATVRVDSTEDSPLTNQADKAIILCNSPRIILTGGKGVGTVTLPGLGLPVGSPAINKSPQEMIKKNILNLLSSVKADGNITVEITLSVPEGEELAKRTFNARLGVIGGISIIGTSGIIQPFSVEAFVSSIRKSMEVAKASFTPRIVINSGAKSEKYLRNYYPELPETAFVQYGNYIGETLKIASELHINNVSLGIMIGKAVKLAEGYLDTHSKKALMNKDFLMKLAEETGCCDATVSAVGQITLARELWEILPPQESRRFFDQLILLCHTHCKPLFNNGKLKTLLINEKGEITNFVHE